MAEKLRSADVMVNLVKASPARLAKLMADPLPEMEKLSDEAKVVAAFVGDKLVYRIAIGVLGTLAILAAIGSIILVSIDKTTPEALVALGAAAVGALVGIFAPSPASK
jgi:hypothetical protein